MSVKLEAYTVTNSERYLFLQQSKRMRKFSYLLFILLGSFFTYSLQAREVILKDAKAEQKIPGAAMIRYTDLSTLPNYVQFRTTDRIPYTSFETWMHTQFHLGTDYGFVVLNEISDQLGYRHVRLQQTFKGIPVIGSMLNVHTRNQNVESFGGAIFEGITASTQAALTEQQALQAALNNVNATTYKWQLPAEEAFLKQEQNDPLASFFPKAKKVILHTKQGFYCCYAFDIYAQEPLSRTIEYVDVQTAAIRLSKNEIEHVNVNGTAVTKYSGTKPFQTDSVSPTSFRLRDASRGLGVQTFNLNHATSYGGAVDFTDADNYWNNVNTNQDEAATDAHWGAQKTYDFMFTVHGRNSIDNAGYLLKSYVHYGNNYNNAFWDGTRMTYGDGAVSSGFLIFTALDVCGHEIGHGLVSNTCDLSATSSGTDECDALNEAYADYMGTSVERNARPTQWDWKIGGDFTCTTAGVPNGEGLRLMSDPTYFGDPKCYQGTNWNTSGEPHANAGPCDYWFYTMVMGNTANSITGLGYSMSDSITYRTLTVHLFPSATYDDARFYSIVSSTELYGGCSLATITTTNAWNHVCVGPAYVPGPAAASFTANATQTCDTSLTVNFTNTSSNMNSCTWYFGDGGTSTQFSPSHTYTVGSYTVKLVINGGTCGNDSLEVTNYIQVGPPAGPATTGDTLCNPGVATLTATLTNANDTIKWYSAAVGGTPLATGTVFTTPSLSSTTTYYAEETVVAPVYHVGPLNNSIGGGGNYTNTTRFMIFNCTSPTILKSVWVFSSSAGNRTIILKDAGGTTLQSVTVNIPNGGSVVTLNMPIPVGNGLQLGLASTSTVNLYRNNTGASYPYTNGPISITGNSAAGSPTYYYFFYDWVLQADPCISTRTATTAIIGGGSGTTPASVTPVGPISICAGSNATLTANTGSGFTYQWYRNNTLISGATSSTYTPTQSGDYYVIVSSAGGCQTPGTSNTVSVTINTAPSASITPTGTQTICAGSTVVMQANTGTGLNYQWYNGSNPITGATSSSYTASAAGSYHVVVTNASGCSATSSNTTINVNTVPTAITTPSGAVTICTGATQLISANTGTGYTYQWLLNNAPISGATSSTYSASTAGNYAVIISVGTGCSDTSSVLALSTNPLPTAVITPSGPTSFCIGGQVILNTTLGSGYTYQWYKGTTLLVGATSSSYTVTQSGTYSVVVTNTLGCTANSNAISVTVNNLPMAITTPSGTMAICSGDSSQIVANQNTGYTFQWMESNNNIGGATNATYWATAAGTYAVIVTDANGCSNVSTDVVVTVNPVPSASITAQGPTVFCQGSSVFLTANSGTNITYQWYQNGNLIAGATSINYNVTASGNYTVKVTNNLGCSAMSNSIGVTVNPLPNAILSCADSSICDGEMAMLGVNSGPGYNYSWYLNGLQQASGTAATFYTMIAGSYVVIVTDQNGCSNTSNQIGITVTPLPTPSIIFSNGILSVTGGPYNSYQWSLGGTPIAGATNATYTPTANGDYTVEVTMNGCRGTGSYHLTTLGVNDLNTVNIQIAPNPFTHEITVEGVDASELRLVDIAGQVVAKADDANTLQVAQVAKGIYFLQVYGENHKLVALRKVLKD